MALNVNAALLKLDPIAPLGLDLPDRKAASMERERLKLMREQFEEVKRQNVQDAEWRKIAEAGETTRAQMASDRQAEHDQQLAIAENMKLRQEAIASMHARGADVEGMHLDANRLNELGGLADYQGVDENGFPSFRVEIDAEKARAADAEQDEVGATYGPNETPPESLSRMNALGYDTLGMRDSQPETAPGAAAPLSTEDAFRSAQRAARGPDEAPPAEPEAPPEDTGVSAYDYAGEADAAKDFAEPGRSTPMAPPPGLEPSIFQATGRPARPADRADIMGSVPKNVIDTGAMQEQRKQRLGPVMDNLVKGMPQAYQAETKANNDAALASGLPPEKAFAEARANRGLAETALRAEQAREAEGEKATAAAAPKPLTRMDIDSLAMKGEGRAKVLYDNNHLDEVPIRSGAAQNMLGILQDDDPNNDQAIAFELPNMLGSRGAQSNKDLAVALGIDAMSTVDQIKERLHNIIDGGYTEMRKESLIAIIENKMKADDGLIYQFLDGIEEGANRAQDEDVRRGLLDYAAVNIPKEYRDAHAAEKAARGSKPAAAPADAAPASGATQGAGAANNRPLHQAPPPPGGLQEDGDFMTMLDAEAGARGLDPDKMLAIIGPESGGNSAAKNASSSASGLIQMIDSVARGYINPRTNENFKDASELRELSAAEQAPIVAKYFADRGVTGDSPVEDYALAVAAPAFVGRSAERDAVVYPKGSKEHAINRPWWPEGGGDVTVGSLLDFYMHTGRHGRGDKRTAAATPTDADLLEGIE